MGHVGELHFAVIAGELTSRETVWGVVNAVGQDPVGWVSVKSSEVREEATRSASHGGKKMGVVSSQCRACLHAFLGPVSELPSEGLIWVPKSGLPSQLSEICLFQGFPRESVKGASRQEMGPQEGRENSRSCGEMPKA